MGEMKYLFGVYLQPADKERAAQDHCLAGFQREKQRRKVQGETNARFL